MSAAIAHARVKARSTLVVATAAADTGNLRFYQRFGFRMRSVERDAFTRRPATSPGSRSKASSCATACGWTTSSERPPWADELERPAGGHHRTMR